MIKFLTLRQFICPLSLFLKEIPFASLTNAIDVKIERVLTGFLIGWNRLFKYSTDRKIRIFASLLFNCTHGISNPLLWYYERLSFGGNEGGFNLPRGGSKYNDKKLTLGSKYHMENLTRGQNIICKLQFTMGFKIPYNTRMVQIKIKIR